MIDYIIEKITDFSWYMETTLISLVLFGEYPYPKKEDYE